MSDEVDLSEKVYTTSEVARIFKVRPATVNTWVKKGKFGVDPETGENRVRFTAGGHARIPHHVLMELISPKGERSAHENIQG